LTCWSLSWAARRSCPRSSCSLAEFDIGAATLEILIEDHHRQQHGRVHGGVLAYAADTALTFAAGSVLGPNVVTSGFTISYLTAAREGTLRAHATVEHSNTKQALCTVRIMVRDGEGAEVLCAVAQGTAIRTSRDAATQGRRQG
jgi:uncharacterized protein (TIGR00369 family)